MVTGQLNKSKIRFSEVSYVKPCKIGLSIYSYILISAVWYHLQVFKGKIHWIYFYEPWMEKKLRHKFTNWIEEWSIQWYNCSVSRVLYLIFLLRIVDWINVHVIKMFFLNILQFFMRNLLLSMITDVMECWRNSPII